MALIDFTGTEWTETDPGADIVITANKIQVDNIARQEGSTVSEDIPLAGMGPYEMSGGLTLRFKATNRTGAGDLTWHRPDVFVLMNSVDDRAADDAANRDYISIALGCDADNTKPFFRLYERDGAVFQEDKGTPGSYAFGTQYFIEVVLLGQVLTAVIRSVSYAGTVIDSLELTLTTPMATAYYSQMLAFRNDGNSGTRRWYGDIEDYEWIAEPSKVDPEDDITAGAGGCSGGSSVVTENFVWQDGVDVPLDNDPPGFWTTYLGSLTIVRKQAANNVRQAGARFSAVTDAFGMSDQATGQVIYKHISGQHGFKFGAGMKCTIRASDDAIEGYFVGLENQTSYIELHYGWRAFAVAWTTASVNLNSAFVFPLWVKFIIRNYGGVEYLFMYVSNDPVVSYTWIQTVNLGTTYVSSSGVLGLGGDGIQVVDDLEFRGLTTVAAYNPFSANDLVPQTLPSVLLNRFLHNWENSVRLESAYRTAVNIAANLAEERKSLVDRPHRTLSIGHVAFTKADAWKLLSNLRRMGNQATVIPLVCDHSRITASSTGVTLNCVTSYRRFFVGGRVMVCKLSQDGHITDEEYDEIDSLTASAITLVSGVSGTFPVGSRVYPCIDAQLALQNEVTLITDRKIQLRFDAEELFGPTALMRTNTTYPASFEVDDNDVPIFVMRPDFGVINEIAIFREGTSYSQGRGQLISPLGDRPLTGYRLHFMKFSRANIWPLIEFFDSVKGRCQSFWYVPVEDFWTLDGINTTYFDIEEEGNFEDASFIDHVAVVLKDGTVLLREVFSRTDLGATWRWTWTDVITVPSVSDIHRVVPAYRMRLTSDSLTEEWTNDEICNLSLELIELVNEGDVTLQCLF